jgi:predicted transcriptional regulator of viral defense system
MLDPSPNAGRVPFDNRPELGHRDPSPGAGRVPFDYRPELGHRDEWRERERELAALAQRQYGVVTTAQLRSLGFSGAGVSRRLQGGRLHGVHRGVYALGRPDLPAHGRWMAAVLACGIGALLSHWSAAALHELLRSSATLIDVTVPRRVGLRHAGLRIHRRMGLTAADRTTVSNIPCTSVAWTLLDLAVDAPDNVLERACDQAEVLRVLDMSAVEDLLARRYGQPGTRRLGELLGAGHVGRDIPVSELERRLVGLCRTLGLPLPEVNVWVPLPGEEIEVDFLWREQRLIVEVDGFETHRTRQAFQRDRRRDQLLRLHGWEVIRFTWDDVTRRPSHVANVIRTLLHTDGRVAVDNRT